MIETAEGAVRWVGAGAVLVVLAGSGAAAVRALGRRPGAASGIARRIGVGPAYVLGAVPFFGICALLWRPLPGTLSDGLRIAALAAGTLLGAGGLALYVAGRRALGEMYNVSSSLGSGLYAGHRLVTTGVYGVVRHPMYVGLFLAGPGGLLVYRTWTFVFVMAALAGAVVKARREDRLLAEEFGGAFDDYRRAVPAWIPHVRRAGPAAPRPVRKGTVTS